MASHNLFKTKTIMVMISQATRPEVNPELINSVLAPIVNLQVKFLPQCMPSELPLLALPLFFSTSMWEQGLPL